MAFFKTDQKSVRVLSSVVKAGAPPEKKNETMVAAMAAQKVAAMSPMATQKAVGEPPMMAEAEARLWPPRRRIRCPNDRKTVAPSGQGMKR
jgi:hypothetical protein